MQNPPQAAPYEHSSWFTRRVPRYNSAPHRTIARDGMTNSVNKACARLYKMLSLRKTTNSRDSKFTNTVENTFTIHIISTLTFELSKFMSKFDGQFSVRRNFRCRCAVKIEQIAACKLDCIAAAEMRQLVNHPMFGCGRSCRRQPFAKVSAKCWGRERGIGRFRMSSEVSGRSVVVHSYLSQRSYVPPIVLKITFLKRRDSALSSGPKIVRFWLEKSCYFVSWKLTIFSVKSALFAWGASVKVQETENPI